MNRTLILTFTYRPEFGEYIANVTRESRTPLSGRAYSFTNQAQAERNLEIIAGAAIEELIKDVETHTLKEQGHVPTTASL